MLIVVLPGAASASPAEDLVRRVEARHKAARDLSARFTQAYRSGVLGREIVERGRLSLKSGGRMRWDYEAPEKKTFVSDGRRFYFYVPADRQVIVKDQGGERSLSSLLLFGGEILPQFTAELQEAEGGLERVQLRPRREDSEVASAVLVVDKEARIRAIEILDPQGSRSRFDFTDLRENTGVPDAAFVFEPPKGVEVVTG